MTERSRFRSRRGFIVAVTSAASFGAGCTSGNPSGANPTAAPTTTRPGAQREDSDDDGVVDANDPFPDDDRWGRQGEDRFARLQTSGVADFGEDINYSFAVESPYDGPWACRVGLTGTVRGSGGGSSMSTESIIYLELHGGLSGSHVVRDSGSVTIDALTNERSFGFVNSVRFELQVRAGRSADDVPESGGEQATVTLTLPQE